MSGDEYIQTPVAFAVKAARMPVKKRGVQRKVAAPTSRTRCLEFSIDKQAFLTAPSTGDQAQDDIRITELRASPEVDTTTEMT